MRWLPIALIVVSNVAYHVGQKAVPKGLHPLAATLGMYLVATVATVALLPVLGPPSWRGPAVTPHWSLLVVGLGIVGIEIGFLVAYRSGWPLTTTAVTATTLVALALLPIGLLFFREAMSAGRAMGLVLAVAGLWLMSR